MGGLRIGGTGARAPSRGPALRPAPSAARLVVSGGMREAPAAGRRGSAGRRGQTRFRPVGSSCSATAGEMPVNSGRGRLGGRDGAMTLRYAQFYGSSTGRDEVGAENTTGGKHGRDGYASQRICTRCWDCRDNRDHDFLGPQVPGLIESKWGHSSGPVGRGEQDEESQAKGASGGH